SAGTTRAPARPSATSRGLSPRPGRDTKAAGGVLPPGKPPPGLPHREHRVHGVHRALGPRARSDGLFILSRAAGRSPDEALDAFATHGPLKAKLVELRFFGSLTLPQAAECLNISQSTAHRGWRYARAWLYTAMAGDESEEK